MKFTFFKRLAASNLKWYLIGILGYFAFGASFFQFLILPQFNKYDGLMARQLDLEGTYVNLAELNVSEAIDSVKLQIFELQELQDVFESRLEVESHFNALMPIIDQYCTNANLTVAKLEPEKGDERVKPHYLKRIINATVIGKYSDFLDFLGVMENNQQWLLIEKLRINTTKEESIYRFSFDISTLMDESA